MTTIRSIMAVPISRKWKIHQLDVNNVFLYGDLNEDIYKKIPEGLPCSNNKVCKMKNSLYGLKEASRQWFVKLYHEPIFQGFQQSKNDYSLFNKRIDLHMTIVGVYVDDIVIIGSN